MCKKNRQYTSLSRLPFERLADEQLLYCIQYELGINDFEDLKDTTAEYDRRHGTELRQAVADVNNAIMHLSEELKATIA